MESGARHFPNSYWGRHIFPGSICQPEQVLVEHLRYSTENMTKQCSALRWVTTIHKPVRSRDCNHHKLKHISWELWCWWWRMDFRKWLWLMMGWLMALLLLITATRLLQGQENRPGMGCPGTGTRHCLQQLRSWWTTRRGTVPHSWVSKTTKAQSEPTAISPPVLVQSYTPDTGSLTSPS